MSRPASSASAVVRSVRDRAGRPVRVRAARRRLGWAAYFRGPRDPAWRVVVRLGPESHFASADAALAAALRFVGAAPLAG